MKSKKTMFDKDIASLREKSDVMDKFLRYMQMADISIFDGLGFFDKPIYANDRKVSKILNECLDNATLEIEEHGNIDKGLSYLLTVIVIAISNSDIFRCQDKRILMVTRELLGQIRVYESEDLSRIRIIKYLLFALDMKTTVLNLLPD